MAYGTSPYALAPYGVALSPAVVPSITPVIPRRRPAGGAKKVQVNVIVQPPESPIVARPMDPLIAALAGSISDEELAVLLMMSEGQSVS